MAEEVFVIYEEGNMISHGYKTKSGAKTAITRKILNELGVDKKSNLTVRQERLFKVAGCRYKIKRFVPDEQVVLDDFKRSLRDGDFYGDRPEGCARGGTGNW